MADWQSLLDLAQRGIREVLSIFTTIVWNVFDNLFNIFLRYMGKEVATILEIMIAGGLAISTYIFMKKFSGGK